MRRARQVLGMLAAVLLVGSVLSVNAPQAGATTFGPVDPTLPDGAPNSLRDIVTNQATSAGGDTVELQPGQTYTLTCAGGGALAHGDTELFLEVPIGAAPATIQQTCPSTRMFSHPGLSRLWLGNLNLTGYSGAFMSPPCGTLNPPHTERTWSTTRRKFVTQLPPTQQDAFSTRVLGVISGGSGSSQQVVFDQTTPNSPSSAQVQALFNAAAAAVAAQGPVAETGPTPTSSSDTSSTTTVTTGGGPGSGLTNTQNTTFGPATILTGSDQSEPLFVPAGCQNTNDNTDTADFETSQVVTTTTHAAVFEITGHVVTPAFTG